MKSVVPLLGALGVMAFGAAASADEVYAPRDATRWNAGYRSLVVELAHGTVELVSFGDVELTPHELAAMQTRHVRMAVTNLDDATPWSIDITALRLGSDDEHAGPVFANSDIATLPLVIIGRGEHRVLDLYFAQPSARSAFDFQWQLKTPVSAFTSTTQFETDPHTTPLPPAEVALPSGWGSRWWCAATHPWPLYTRRDGPIRHRTPRAVTVTGLPRLHRR